MSCQSVFFAFVNLSTAQLLCILQQHHGYQRSFRILWRGRHENPCRTSSSAVTHALTRKLVREKDRCKLPSKTFRSRRFGFTIPRQESSLVDPYVFCSLCLSDSRHLLTRGYRNRIPGISLKPPPTHNTVNPKLPQWRPKVTHLHHHPPCIRFRAKCYVKSSVSLLATAQSLFLRPLNSLDSRSTTVGFGDSKGRSLHATSAIPGLLDGKPRLVTAPSTTFPKHVLAGES